MKRLILVLRVALLAFISFPALDASLSALAAECELDLWNNWVDKLPDGGFRLHWCYDASSVCIDTEMHVYRRCCEGGSGTGDYVYIGKVYASNGWTCEEPYSDNKCITYDDGSPSGCDDGYQYKVVIQCGSPCSCTGLCAIEFACIE